MSSFMSKGQYRDLFDKRKVDEGYRPPTAEDAPEMGEGAWFDPVTQTTYIPDQPQQQQAPQVLSEPAMDGMGQPIQAMEQQPVQQEVPQFGQSISTDEYDDPDAMFYKERKAEWTDQLSRAWARKPQKDIGLQDWLKFVKGVSGQKYGSMGTQDIQGSIQQATIKYMPPKAKREYEEMQMKEKMSSGFDAELAQAKQVSDLLGQEHAVEFTGSNFTTRPKDVQQTGTEQIRGKRGDELNYYMQWQQNDPSIKFAVPQGKTQYEAIKSPNILIPYKNESDLPKDATGRPMAIPIDLNEIMSLPTQQVEPTTEMPFLSQQDFIAEFQADYGRPPTEAEVMSSQNKYWR